MSRNYDPWGNVMNQANNAVFKYLYSRPNQAEIDQKSAITNLHNLQAEQIRQNLNTPGKIEQSFHEIYSPEMDRPSSDFVGPLPQYEGGVPPKEIVNQRYQQRIPQLIGDSMRYSGNNPGNLGDVFLAFAANGGASPEQISNAQLGAGAGYGNTREGTLNKPFTLSPGAKRFDYTGKEVASAPFKKGGSGDGFNITLPDGTVINQGGFGPELTNSNKTDLQSKDISLEAYQVFSDNYGNELRKSPGAAGTRGNLARLADSVSGQVQQFAPGSPIAKQIIKSRNTLAGKYTDPATGKIVDQDLYAAATIADYLPYAAAAAITGQTGKSLSNDDYAIVKNAVGSPEDWLATNEKLLARKNQVDNIVYTLRGKYQDRLINSNSSIPKDQYVGQGSKKSLPMNEKTTLVPTNGWNEENERRLQELEELLGEQ